LAGDPAPISLELDRARIDRLVEVRDGYYDYRPIFDTGVGVEWHVNFADPNLFYAYGSVFFAQDEIQVAEHPILGSLREAIVAEGRPATTMANGRPTPGTRHGGGATYPHPGDAERGEW
jgi:hypothetical protein